ncbi:PTS fructose transporter subunit IIB [Schaedlerella arabinosiphila]|uniref:PTS fructose transporter subunit IIB n=1 Tax=Schaedlerella arabinosiphila TaxID=2044587 RepID=A0A9X5CD78_9FIRM|nr:PTS transporter subunit EIIC [Schaedlerella arabinosiphila]KAI4444094.1 PTS system beta-glucoside-specific EIIBCA component [Schaedlerella arabinosiphila]NDO70632.1 PTS fructose transporter subunit IIB [Schaedlerella arabinosiphila]
MADYKQIAKRVLEAVGGSENIEMVTHCMTRLRFNLKDDAIPNDDAIRAIDGVAGVARNPGQYQIIIGTQVSKVYKELCEIGNVGNKSAAQEHKEDKKKKMTAKSVGNAVLNYMAGCMTPMIPVLLAAGLCRTLNSVLGPDMLGLYGMESNLYILFDFLFDAGLYFMPILVGFNAAKILDINQMLGAFIGCILLVPDFAALAEAGNSFTVFGIPCTLTAYGQTVIPVMISVWVFSLIYKIIQKIMPDLLTTIFTPFLSVIISIPFILCFCAPLGTMIGNEIGAGLAAFGQTTGFFGIAIISALWEFLVMTGMHLALMMPMMASYFETGVMTGPAQAGGFATWACFGVALGAALRLKNKKEKTSAFGAFVSGIVGTVTEPTLYGICFKYRRCFIGLFIGGFLGGAYAGITNVCTYVLSSGNFLSLLGYTGGTTANLINGVIACLLSMVSAAVFTFIFGFSKEELKK